MQAALLGSTGTLERLAATPAFDLLVWSVLVAVGVMAIILLRTGWGQSRPLARCAVLSLLVHVLLACAAMTVKIVVGSGETWQAGPIRIRVLDIDSMALASVAPELTPPPLLQETPTVNPPAITEAPVLEQEAIDQQVEAFVPTAAANSAGGNVATIQTLAPAVEISTPTFVPVEAELAADERPDEQNANSGEPVPDAGIHAADTTPNQAAASVDPSDRSQTRPVAAGSDPYRARKAADRQRLIELNGGSSETEAAVVAALNWLAAVQSPDGRWDADRHGAGVERGTLGKNRNGAGRDADTGITALALLAFLGAGHTQLEGDYRPTVERGLEFLLRSQAEDGSMFGGAGLYAQMYCHAMATFALAEAQALSGDRRLAPGVSRAVAFCVRAQHPTDGGWRYEVGNRGDTSQLGWQTMAIASGERAGLAVPLQTWTGMERFLRSVAAGQFGGLASYQPRSGPTTSMTAEALYCRLMLADKSGLGLDEHAATEATRQILAHPPTRQSVNLYYWYYATLALHHRHTANPQADGAWRLWNQSLTSVLLGTQIRDGAAAGSWDPDFEWGGYGGRVYSTALAAMCLEVYYRYAPTGAIAPAEIVTRPLHESSAR